MDRLETVLMSFIPVFAALSVPDHVVKYCTCHRLYALGLGPETMQRLNFRTYQHQSRDLISLIAG